MFAVIREYNLNPGTVEGFIQQVQKGLLPIISLVPGFKAYYLVDIGDNKVAVISMFETLDDAKASAQKTVNWVAEHTDLYFQGFSKPMSGQVRVQSDAAFSMQELLRGSF